MQYSTQAIVCLAGDLRETAEALQTKRTLAGDARGTINQVEQVTSSVHYWPAVDGLPQIYAANANGTGGFRLIIIGHGNPESTHIVGDGIRWTPAELNTQVEEWLGRRVISRISLHMCFGGGNPTGRLGPMPVAPGRSFAAEFTRICRCAQSVSARTDVVSMQTTSQAGAIVGVQRIVGDDSRHKGSGDKYVFTHTGNGNIRMQWR
jgi:hypothetical protein